MEGVNPAASGGKMTVQAALWMEGLAGAILCQVLTVLASHKETEYLGFSY